jgi:hypothetical protein
VVVALVLAAATGQAAAVALVDTERQSVVHL